MKLTVLVPTHRRAAELSRCLDALLAQTRPADQIVIVARRDDYGARARIACRRAAGAPIDLVLVHEPGIVHALNAGLARVAGDIVAITDDDAAPWPDWLERIERHFAADPRLGGLGGRDVIRRNGDAGPPRARVGRVSWFGHWVGQAHRGIGPARDVELLKGCNMSYRRTAFSGLGFDPRLRGAGAQWFNDSAFSLAIRRSGWRVIYDPAVRVDHYLEPRPDGDDRHAREPEAVYDVVYNESLILLEHLTPAGRLAFLGFGIVMGTRRAPGLAQWIRSLARGPRLPSRSLLAAWRARRAAWLDHRPLAPGEAPVPVRAADRREVVA